MSQPAFKLSEQQQFAMTELSGMKNFYALKGYAGTGKTTVITHWVQEMSKRPGHEPGCASTLIQTPQGRCNCAARKWRKPKIVLTAPTNKATNVLKDKCREIGLPVDTSTIHSLLSLKMRWEKDVQVLVADSRGEDNFGEYDYVVIDESSMLGKEMMGYIYDAQARAKNKVIFMGDPCQLPPVNEEDSESFKQEATTELTTILRQAEGNPIMDLSIYLRECIEDPKKLYPYPVRIFDFIDDKNILHRPLGEYQDEILGAFKAAEDEEIDIRHVAWTNKVVDGWNDKIRDVIYGEDRDEWTEGERVVTTAPVMDRHEQSVIFTTDTLLTISQEPKEVIKHDIPCWQLRARAHNLFVVQRGATKAFIDKRELLVKQAKDNRKLWWKFYEFMETFAQIKPAYSLTVHRSQGSTFDDVYVSLSNILKNPNRKEKLQCLYVAITRPRRRLILV